MRIGTDDFSVSKGTAETVIATVTDVMQTIRACEFEQGNRP